MSPVKVCSNLVSFSHHRILKGMLALQFETFKCLKMARFFSLSFLCKSLASILTLILITSYIGIASLLDIDF